ncbi:hypothetical protein ACIBU0_07655 [Streptomyces sp. NPDC049627]|uniref:hypothetical protein n=1 Tax=Streptomyces sp. NPDC049627 TaxID=3365595 RepID=UPI0037BB8566
MTLSALSWPDWLESGTLWTVAIGALASILSAVAGAWVSNKYSNPKRELQYQWRKNTSLLETSSSSASSLTVTHGSTPLAEPRVIDVLLRNHGRREITSGDFHNGDPITVKLDCLIVELKGVHSEPPTSIAPLVTVSSSNEELLVSPCLLVGGQEVVITVVADGPGDENKFELRSPLVGMRPPKLITGPGQEEKFQEIKKNAQAAGYFLAGVAVAMLFLFADDVPDSWKHDPIFFDQKGACKLLSEDDAKNVGCP